MSEENKTHTPQEGEASQTVAQVNLKATQEETSAAAQHDLMDGGFAVVDRERLIAEEMKGKVPWYKNLMNLFVAPSKTMHETIEADPVKGIGLGLGWSAVFALIYMLIYYMNPLQKIALYDAYRKQGKAEEELAQVFQMGVISKCLTIVIAVAFSALITAIIFVIIKAIFRDKGSFKKLYIIALLSQVVTYAISIIDGILQYLVGTTTTILGIGAIFSAETVAASPLLWTLSSIISVSNLWSLVVLVVGYKVMTRKSTTKAVVVVGVYELLIFASTYGMFMLGQSAMQMMG